MRKLSFLSILLMSLANVYAGIMPIAEPIIEHEFTTGFVPHDMAGVYRFQVLSNGNLIKIDHKGMVTHLGTLAPAVITGLEEVINDLDNIELTLVEGPICMDAPKTVIRVWDGTGEMTKIWKRSQCRNYIPNSGLAKNLANVINKLENSFAQLQIIRENIEQRK